MTGYVAPHARMADTAREELGWLLRRYQRKARLIVVASVAINLLIFGSSIYTLVLYDSIIPSRSVPSLVAIFVILIFLFCFQFAFEHLRIDAIGHMANGIYDDLREPVHRAAVSQSLHDRSGHARRLPGDLQVVHAFLVGGGPAAIVDLPWVLPILLLLTLLDPLLGLVGVAGAVVLALLSWRTVKLTEGAAALGQSLAATHAQANEDQFRFAQIARAMGFTEQLRTRSLTADDRLRDIRQPHVRAVSLLSMAGRLFRLFLQMAVLTVGALLVINFDASGGIMIAASILIGRALAPVDLAIAQSRNMSAAFASWKRILAALASELPAPEHAVQLPRPSERMEVSDLWVTPPGGQAPVLKGIGFSLVKGDVLAIVGTSAAGKSTLAKALLGLWPVSSGEIRFDGATADQWAEGALAKAIGYVPQEIDLIAGSVAENISRFDASPDPGAVMEAAALAGIHDMITAFPGGYDFHVGESGANLSVGQRQRVAIARAVYGAPFLVVFDEANSSLDTDGDEALGKTLSALRQRQAITIIVTQRASVLQQVTHIAILRDGAFSAFGPREAVLGQLGGGPATGSPAQPVKLEVAKGRQQA